MQIMKCILGLQIRHAFFSCNGVKEIKQEMGEDCKGFDRMFGIVVWCIWLLTENLEYPSKAWTTLLAVALFHNSIGLAYGSHGVKFQVTALPLTTKAQKQQSIAGGEGFQMVMSISYAPSNPTIAYLATDTSQIWKSLDSGVSWAPVNNGYHALGSRSLFVHPQNPEIVFSAASFGKHYSKAKNMSPYQGIYRSMDGGNSWEMMLHAPFFRQDSRGSLFAVDSTTLSDKDFTIFVGTFDGDLLVSRDSGVNWSNSGFSTGRIREVVELPNSLGSLLVASEDGLFRYDGKVAKRIGKGLPTWPRSIAVSQDGTNVVYAALGKDGVFKSVNGGEHFQRSTYSPFLGEINDIEVSSLDSNIAIYTKSGRAAPGPFFTYDGGENWDAATSINERSLTNGGGFFFSSPIAMHPKEENVALTSSNSKARLLITTDGGKNWSYSGSGFRGGRLIDVVFLSSNKMIFNLTDHGAWRTIDGALSFVPIPHPRKGGKSIGSGAMSGDTLVLSIGSYKVKHLLVSFDRGRSWKHTNIRGYLRFISSHSVAPNVFYAGKYISKDGGNSWQELQHRIVEMDPFNNDIVYAFKKEGKGSQLLVSKNRGASWETLGSQLDVMVKAIKQVVADPFSKSRIYVATSKGLWILSNHKWYLKGERHGLLPDFFGSQFVETVMASPVHSGLIFAGRRSPGKGMANGLFYSFDHGETWRKISGVEMSNTNIWSININPYDGVTYVGTSHGVYKLELQ